MRQVAAVTVRPDHSLELTALQEPSLGRSRHQWHLAFRG